jgi:hypothetical protein
VAFDFSASAARARARSAPREADRAVIVGWRERRENDLAQMGIVLPLSIWLGHNNGPDILESLLFKEWRWTRVREAAFTPPAPQTGARWARKAEELGLSYAEYRLELLERGRYPTEEDAKRIRDARTSPGASR